MKNNWQSITTAKLWIFLGTLLLVVHGEARDWTSGQNLTFVKGASQMPYRLYLPADYSAAQKYPVIIFMHGSGERGTDNEKQVKSHIRGLIGRTESDYPAILVAPQLPSGSYWSNTDDLTIDILQHVVSSYSVDVRRIYCTGLSLGGFGTTNYVYYYPHLFAAIAPFSGAYLSGPLLQNHPQTKLPTWLFHGSNDRAVDVEYSRNYFKYSTGLSSIIFDHTFYGYTTAIQEPIRYTELAGKPHVIWDEIYNHNDSDLYDWMFSNVRAETDEMSMKIQLSDGDLIIEVLSDRPFAEVILHTSQTLGQPLADWSTNSSSRFDASGKVVFTVPKDSAEGKRFFRASSP